MKPSLLFLLAIGCGLTLAACSDDTSSPGASAGSSGELEAGADAAGAGEAGAGADEGGRGGATTAGGGKGGAATAGGGKGGTPSVGGGGASVGLGGESGQAENGGDAGSGNEVPAWYRCQSSDQAFVRRAILGVLGRRAYSQSEVDVYTQIIQQIDLVDGLTDEQKLAKPETELRHSR